jgi:hypothetical protein
MAQECPDLLHCGTRLQECIARKGTGNVVKSGIECTPLTARPANS